MRQKTPQQALEERVKNFFEVTLGFSKEQAEEEAKRCIQCNDPLCVKGCPVEIDIPAFIKLISEGKQKEALEKIKERNNLPAVCGRVCPQEDQCEGVCILNKKKIPINIGALERYAADYVVEVGTVPVKAKLSPRQGAVPKRVAIVGSGPAGLTCAADLAKMVTGLLYLNPCTFLGGCLFMAFPNSGCQRK